MFNNIEMVSKIIKYIIWVINVRDKSTGQETGLYEFKKRLKLN